MVHEISKSPYHGRESEFMSGGVTASGLHWPPTKMRSESAIFRVTKVASQNYPDKMVSWMLFFYNLPWTRISFQLSDWIDWMQLLLNLHSARCELFHSRLHVLVFAIVILICYRLTAAGPSFVVLESSINFGVTVLQIYTLATTFNSISFCAAHNFLTVIIIMTM